MKTSLWLFHDFVVKSICREGPASFLSFGSCAYWTLQYRTKRVVEAAMWAMWLAFQGCRFEPWLEAFFSSCIATDRAKLGGCQCVGDG